MSGYASASDVRKSVAGLVRPRERVSVSEVAEKALRIVTPGGYAGPIDLSEFPYMREPLDLTGSRNVEAEIFVGPAQAAKTFSLIGGRIAFAVVADPADQLLIQMSQDTARDWSRKELDRWIRNSPELLKRTSGRARDDNTYDKFWSDGSVLKIGWPSVTQVSSKSVRDGMVTDYDRIPDDIDGEGSLFGLVMKRTTVWMSRGITIVESSPGRDIPREHANWRAPEGSNLAPPVSGILGLYSQGDRRRWHWPCPECGEYFQAAPGVSCFAMPDLQELKKLLRSHSVDQLIARFQRVVCPHCGSQIDQAEKRRMNLRGVWLVEGEQISAGGIVTGQPVRSAWASHWLGGVAAAFLPWAKLVERYLKGVSAWAQSGDYTLLKQTINTDQAAPFLVPGPERQQTDIGLRSQAETWERGTVPAGVRFLLATVDVQINRFVCQVTGFGWTNGRLEWWMVDRFEISESLRGGSVRPATYSEDWLLINERMQSLRYALPDGRAMQVLHTSVDSGGASDDSAETSVTMHAYAWWRAMQARGLAGRFGLVKGSNRKDSPRVDERRPDTRATGGASRGDVPVLFINTMMIKDKISGDLQRSSDGEGTAHLPDWLEPSVYAELVGESRGPNGWIRAGQTPQEAFDLSVYAMARAIFFKADTPQFWAMPPAWAGATEANPLVLAPGAEPVQQRRPVAQQRGVRSTASAF